MKEREPLTYSCLMAYIMIAMLACSFLARLDATSGTYGPPPHTPHDSHLGSKLSGDRDAAGAKRPVSLASRRRVCAIYRSCG